ncbi:MAG TPA: hypothetical protein VF834_12215 [Streptosporangiaceae bacterium]
MGGWHRATAGCCGMALLAALAVAGPTSGAAAAPTGSNSTWAVQDSPDVTVPSGQVQAVSCPSATSCMAVGYYLDSAGLTVPLAETWNGTSWQQQTVPSPAGGRSPGLDGVSCISASFCEAVGITDEPGYTDSTAFAETWNGSSWSLQAVPSPAGATGVLLKAVSCASATFCEAVGSYLSSSYTILSLAEEWNGTTWTLQSTPSQTASAPAPTQLDGVSCVSATFCEAVDFYGLLAERWNGTSWRAHSVAVPSGTSSPGLYAVSCRSRTFCEVVGTYVDPSSSAALTLFAERWDGTSWHEQSVPNSASWKTPTAVSCASAAACETVGYKEVYTTGGDTFHAIAEVWNGTSWQAQRPTSASGTALTELNGVSCAAANACEAGGALPVRMEAWNGTSWATQPAVVPLGAASNALGAVSCASATFCAAVGDAATAPALADTWDGSAWTIRLRSTSAAVPLAVSCVSATFCEAVGSSASGTAAAAEVWNGISWQPQPTPGPDYAAVSCVSASFCEAVGPNGAAMWNGTVWSAQSIPVGVTGGRFSGVSCTAVSACEAVGSPANSAGGSFAAGWDGTSWTAQAVPSPVGATHTWLNHVSCSAAGACMAVGRAIVGTTLGGYAAVWDGTGWTAQTAAMPVPAGARQVTPLSIACTSSASCTVVGYSVESASPYVQLTLAEAWDGTSWTIEPTPDPAATGNVLNGVSCLSAGPCVAVGSAPDPGGYNATLVEATG